jgi:hypothetical protein
MIAILNSHAARLALTIAAVFMLLLLSVGGCFWLIRIEVGTAQSQWCDTLTLLTAHPVSYPADPEKNPSRLQSYYLYQDFLHLRDRFGCK